jgi:hypothetical protein
MDTKVNAWSSFVSFVSLLVNRCRLFRGNGSGPVTSGPSAATPAWCATLPRTPRARLWNMARG